MKRIIMLVAILAVFVVAKSNDCYKLGSKLIETFEGCYLEKSSSKYIDYTCYNGVVSIEKESGDMVFVQQDSRGSLTLIAGRYMCAAELLDEYGVAIVPMGTYPKGDNGQGLYKKFKNKFRTRSANSVNTQCPPSWKDSNGACDSRYFE